MLSSQFSQQPHQASTFYGWGKPRHRWLRNLPRVTHLENDLLAGTWIFCSFNKFSSTSNFCPHVSSIILMDSGPHLDLSLWYQYLSPPDLFLPLGSNVLGGNLYGLLFTYRLMATSTSVCHGHFPSPGPTSWSWIPNAATISSRTPNGNVRVPTQTEGRKTNLRHI